MYIGMYIKVADKMCSKRFFCFAKQSKIALPQIEKQKNVNTICMYICVYICTCATPGANPTTSEFTTTYLGTTAGISAIERFSEQKNICSFSKRTRLLVVL
jgi:hypothetical protein